MNKIFSEDQTKRFGKDIVRYFKADRQISANDFKIDVVDDIDPVILKGAEIRKADDSDFPIAFDLKDTEIVNLILAQNLIAAQNFYKQGLSAHVVSVIRSIVKESGLSQADQKKLITSEMAKALGLKKQAPKSNKKYDLCLFIAYTRDALIWKSWMDLIKELEMIKTIKVDRDVAQIICEFTGIVSDPWPFYMTVPMYQIKHTWCPVPLESKCQFYPVPPECKCQFCLPHNLFRHLNTAKIHKCEYKLLEI